MSKTTVKEESKAGKKEDVGSKVEEEKLEKKPKKEEVIAESKPEEKAEGKPEKVKVEPVKEEKEVEKAQVSTGQSVEAEKKEGEAKVEEVAEVRGEITSKIKDIMGSIEKMTVLELSDLVKALEDKFGVVAVAPAAAGASTATPMDEAKEKTEWSVVLTAAGAKKIQVIKEVRAITSLGLKEAKTLVEEAPKPVKEGILQKEAEEIKAKLEAAGATVELK